MQARRLALYSAWMFWHQSLCGIELWKGRETAGWCQLQYQVLPILRQSRGILIVSLAFSSFSFILSIYLFIYSVFRLSFSIFFFFSSICLSIHLFSFFVFPFPFHDLSKERRILLLPFSVPGSYHYWEQRVVPLIGYHKG